MQRTIARRPILYSRILHDGVLCLALAHLSHNPRQWFITRAMSTSGGSPCGIASMDGPRAPTSELVLILVSVLFSLLLATHVAFRERLRLPPVAEVGVVLLLVAGCLACAVTALTLAFLGRLSLDAMSTSLIGFLPAVQAMPLVDLRLPVARVAMRRRAELRMGPHGLRYIRLGTYGVGEGQVHLFSATPDSPAAVFDEEAGAPFRPVSVLFILRHTSHLYGRRWPFRRRLSTPLTAYAPRNYFNGTAIGAGGNGGNSRSVTPVRHWHTLPPHPEQPRYPLHFFHGAVLRPGAVGANVVHLADYTASGDPVRWWTLILDAAHVVAHPDHVQLSSRPAVVSALVCAADLVVAGDLVLYHFSRPLRDFLASSVFQMALRGTPASVANAVMERVGLSTQWGCVDAASIAFVADYHTFSRGRRYRVLFFMITVSSSLFDWRPPTAVTGPALAERLTSAVGQAAMRQLTTQWLAGWGLDFPS